MAVDTARISELLDEAIDAVNTGDLATAHDLAERVLHDDADNQEASELLATEGAAKGELRRLTILCCDLVGSTELSERLDPERYRTLVNRYQVLARAAIEDRYEGHIVSVKGDGFLSLFGYPNAHEDDTYRAVRTAIELCAGMEQLSGQAQRAMGEAVSVRIGIHRGLVFIDLDEDDVYGLAANLAARTATLAEPGSVVMTDAVRRLVEDRFEVVAATPQTVKGVSEPVQTFALVGERSVPSGRAFAAPLVGRDEELARLRDAWSETKRGVPSRPQAVLIRGEPGIGKSRLAQALIAEVGAEDATVLELVGSPFHSDAGFHPVQVLLEARSGIDRGMDAEERLTRLRQSLERSGTDPEVAVPWLAPILGLPPESGYQPVEAEGRKLSEDITDVVLRYLVDGFGDRPGVLLVEDLQWIDDSTTNLIEQLRTRGPATILVVVTTRPDGQLTAETEIEIGPLGEADRLALVDAVDTLGLPPAVSRSLALRSDGIPLYVEELVRGWEAGRDGADDVTVDAVPDALYEPLLARLPSSEAGITVTAAAATVGRRIDRRMLAGVLDLDPSVLERELEALIADSILVPAEQHADELGFRHELLREVAYELQPPATRRRVHGRIADLLVKGGESPDVVDWNVAATHYEQAGRKGEAAIALAHAADRARRRGALTEARTHLGRSIEMVAGAPDRGDDTVDEVSLRLRRGFLAMTAEGAGSAEAASDYARCLELAMSDARGDGMFSALISLWAYHLARAELDRAGDVLDVLRQQLQGSREWFRPANRAGYGMIEWFRGHFEPALALLEQSRGELTGSRVDSEVDETWFVPNDPTASIHVHLALARFMRGDTAGADAAFADGIAVTDDLDFPQGPWSGAYGAWLRSWAAAERGDLDAAHVHADLLVDLADRHGFDNWTMIGVTHQYALTAMQAAGPTGSDPAVAAQALVAMLGMWEAVELRVFLPFYATTAGAAAAAAGDVEAAEAHYDQADSLGASTGMQFYAAETARRRALLDPATDASVDRLRSALELARAQGTRPFEVRIALDLHDRIGTVGIPDLRCAVEAHPDGATSADLDAARARLSSTP